MNITLSKEQSFKNNGNHKHFTKSDGNDSVSMKF